MGIGASKKDHKDDRKKWLECRTFDELPPDGRKAIIAFAEEHRGSNDKRCLEFWYKCKDSGQLTSFLSPYLSGETQLPAPYFRNVKKELSDPETFLSRAQEIDDAISEIKDSMRSDLDECFREFLKFLEKDKKGS